MGDEQQRPHQKKKGLIQTDWLESKYVHALNNTTERNSLEEVHRIVIHNGVRHTQRNKTLYFLSAPTRTQNKRVEERCRHLESGRTQK